MQLVASSFFFVIAWITNFNGYRSRVKYENRQTCKKLSVEKLRNI